jgi:hypothetical protein
MEEEWSLHPEYQMRLLGEVVIPDRRLRREEW